MLILKEYLSLAFYVAVVVFVIFYFKDIEWSLILSVDVAWGYMFFSFIVRMAGLLILPIAWKILLSNFGNKLSNKNYILSMHSPGLDAIFLVK